MVLFFYTEGVPLLLHRRYSFSFTPKVFLFFYTEGVREFQPRVELWQPWGTRPLGGSATLSGLRAPQHSLTRLIPRVAKAQPWAEIREHLRCNAPTVGFHRM